ncbi:flagellar hook-basal body complex protein [Romboutsia lituseburensis]|uniref:flagellar hook-basal body complex protein n=1 Tax=Romboutsia lituseburensis TaxID=1537 RepID=UPI00215A43DB|nr:flagellar hook-basal body complex protein [Romboutsia lituseburensis]MCR8746735.1 flagellar hook-basal body complex protein [Romboutsia lituseburensis]
MLRGLYSSVSSMLTLQARQGVITNNLANIVTPGYKQETLASKSFDEVMLYNKDKYINGVGHQQYLGDLSFGVRIDETVTSYQQGTHKETGNNTDFALEGKGFFQVMDGNNNPFYTRDGSFKINTQGYLVTNAGHYVTGVNSATGAVEPIYVGNDKVSVTPDNKININGINKYTFNVVDFENYDKLIKRGDNLYSGENGTKANNYRVRQGYLETSNVDYINETALLMETVKEFEANQKVIQTIDSTLSKIANEIGTVR